MPPPAATHFAALQRDTRARRWLLAAVVGANAWLFTNLVLEWHHAILPAAAATVGLLLWDHWRGGLTEWWPATRTSHRLAAAAARLEAHGWLALPNPAIPGLITTDIHLLVGPAGVFVVEPRFRASDDLIPHLRAVADSAQRRLAAHLPAGMPVRPVIAVVEGPAPEQPHVVDGVTVLHAADLMRHLRAIPPTAVAGLQDAARRLFTSS